MLCCGRKFNLKWVICSKYKSFHMFLKCWTQGEIFHLSLLPPLLLLLLLHSHRDSIHSSSGTVERKLFSWCWCEKHACTQTNTLPTNWHHRSMCEQFDVTTNIIAHEKWYFLTHWMCESMWTIPCVVWKMGEKKPNLENTSWENNFSSMFTTNWQSKIKHGFKLQRISNEKDIRESNFVILMKWFIIR